MSKQLDRLAACEQITEWLTPHDRRLIEVTGLTPPVDAERLREPWRAESPEESNLLAREVGRLLIPAALAKKVRAVPSQHMVQLKFDDDQDWPQILPKSGETLIFNHVDDDFFARGHAAIAVCGKTAALAVIAMEDADAPEYRVLLNFLVMPIRQDKFKQIIAS